MTAVQERLAPVRRRPGPKGPNLNHDGPQLPHAGGKPDRRQCLRCKQPFDSAGIGERVCGACKLKPSYRAGPFVDEMRVLS